MTDDEWTVLENPLSPEQERELSGLLGEGLLPALRRIVAEAALWKRYHDDEPRPAEAVKRLKRFAAKLKVAADAYDALPDEGQVQVAASEQSIGIRWDSRAFRRMALHLEIAAEREEVPTGRRGEFTSYALARAYVEAVGRAGIPLSKSRPPSDADIRESVQGRDCRALGILLAAIGHPVKDAYPYLEAGVDALKQNP